MHNTQMSFSWSTSANPSCPGIKPVATNSFADALKKLAENVEEKNKNNTNTDGNSSHVQLSTDFPNQMMPLHVNHTMSPEQTLRLYTQYIHEAERREDIRRRYLRTYSGLDNANINVSALNRRLESTDSCRFISPHLSSLFHSPAYLQLLAQQTRMQQPTVSVFQNIKTTDATSRIPKQENTNKKSFDNASDIAKPKLKIFRPYDLDNNTNSSSYQTSPCSLPNVTKKSSSSPSICVNSNSTLSDELETVASFGKEKQLFNSLGLVQQSIDAMPETSSSSSPSSITVIVQDSMPIETNSTKQNNHFSNTQDSSLLTTHKRKSVFAANEKQSKSNKVNNAME